MLAERQLFFLEVPMSQQSAIDLSDVARLRIALARIARLVDRQVSGDGLTRTQLSVLGTLGRHHSLGIGELADLEGLNPTMLSRVVGKLESAGLLDRSPDPADGRVVRVRITAAGTALHEQLRDARTTLFTEILSQLVREDAELLLRALPALESLAEHLRQAPMPAPSDS
jgi:DNA-binding MarR family transcriptional regulator